MELRQSAPPLLAATLALLILALATGAPLFYAALAILATLIAWDATKLYLAASSLGGDLAISSSLSRHDLYPGMHATYTIEAAYHGRMPGIVLTLSPLPDGPPAARPAPAEIVLRRGGACSRTAELMPEKPGDYAVGPVRVRVASRMFAAVHDAGEPLRLRVRLPIGEHVRRQGAGMGHRRSAAAWGGPVEKRRGHDFSGVRQYMPGDRVKNVDWALTSRAGGLVVREFEAERTEPVYLLVDLSPSTFEAAIASAAALFDRQLVEGERTGLICFSRSGIVEHVRMGMGREHVRRLSDALSRMRPAEDAAGAGPNASAMELYAAGRAIRDAAGVDALRPVIEETLGGYIANVREDGFIRAVLAASRDAGAPCEVRVVTGLSMGLLCLTYGLRLARYYGHGAAVMALLPADDGEHRLARERAEGKLRALSVKILQRPEGGR